jgi:hypothetical protein
MLNMFKSLIFVSCIIVLLWLYFSPSSTQGWLLLLALGVGLVGISEAVDRIVTDERNQRLPWYLRRVERPSKVRNVLLAVTVVITIVLICVRILA